MVGRRHRILQPRSLQTIVGHPGPAWGEARDLAHHVLGGAEGRRQAQTIAEVDENLEVGSSLPGGIDGFVRELDAPLRVHERPCLLSEARSRQDHVGVARGFGEEEIVDREEFDLLKPVLGMGDIGIGDDRILAHDVHATHAALGLHDFGEHETALERQRFFRYAPGASVARAHARVGDRLIVGIRERDRADIRSALHIILATHREHRGTPAPDHPAGEHQVEQ